MATNKLVIEYPRGLDLNVTFVNSDGKKVDSIGMTPPLLLRLGPNLEFVGMTSGSLRTVLDLSGSESDDTNSEENQDEQDSAMDLDTSPANDTINLVTSEDEDDADDTSDVDDDTSDDDDYSETDDIIIVSHPTEA